ncbi:MAG: amino acid adenylation domain-containing protein, partial [Gemmatimonadaceae bacterium]
MRVRDDYWHMVWTFHHILMDGRSFPMVLREVFAVYEASLRGETVAVMPRRPFSDFVDWYTTQDFSKHEGFWRERLRGIPGPTPLPAAFHDVGNQSREGRGLQARMLSRSATSALNKLARDNRLTMNNVVQGAWSLLLSRHSGESEIVFGATRACRKETIEAADDIIGLFINTVPVRVTVRNDMPLVQWLDELREGWRALFEAEHTPVRLIQRWSEGGMQTPLFDSQVVFENLPIDVTLQGDGGAMAKRGFHLYGHTNFALTALVFGGEELSLELENDRSLVDDATAARLLDHLASIFESMAENPSATVGDLTMLPARERALVVDAWNDTAKRYPADATLVSLFGEQVRRAPDAIAVVDERRSLTYAELDRAAGVLAHTLRAHGVCAGVLVGVCAERSVEMVIALVAAIKAGGAYVPIDPEYPQDRVAFMLDDAGAPVLLAHSHIVASLPAHGARVLLLDGVADAATGSDVVTQLPPPAPDDSAYMIYTSGSTGRPKGARNAHRGIVNRLLWMQDTHNLTSRDVVLQKTPFSFDVSVWEFFWPLLTGAKLVMARAGGHKDTGYLSEVVQAHGVSVCHFVPSMLRAFVADARSAACTSLRDVMASGEALPADLVAAFNKRLPAAQLHNLYGPTECAVDVTFWPCPKDIAPTAVVPIGRPVANTQVYVLDEKLQPMAVGVPGELYLAGVQVGQGYHKRAELTAERFVPDTFASSRTGARMYRTGDRARWRPDGTVEYLGRLDFQVKIRGFRIELGEIENALLAHDAVRDAVVVAYADPSSDGADSKKLVAYVVGEGGAQSTAAVRAALLERLPDYMVPAIFVWLPALPLSSNGKIDRRALPAPEVERNSLSRAFVAPSTREEVLLANIWKLTLKVADVGVEDNFFELGGDSLLGVQILARAASAGLRVTLTQLLRTPTVAALARAAAAEALANGGALRSRASELRNEVFGALPLTPVQHWFFENQGETPHHWNQSFMFSVNVDVDASALERAIEAVIVRHDSFRLRFSRDGESWTQKLQPSNSGSDFVFASHDLRASATGSTAQVTALAAVAQSSLNIETGPLLRADLFTMGTERARLLITVHHLAIDGVSWRIVREDIEYAYQQIVSGKPVSFDTAGTPFSAWAHETARPAAVQPFERDLAYWEKAGATSTKQIPRDAMGGDSSAQHAETIALRLSADETRDLFQRVPQAYNTQINDVLISALSDSLSQWIGDGEFVVNVEGHGREDIVPGADISRTTGWFTTIFPVRLKLQRATVASCLKETKELLRAVPNRGLSYGALRYLSNSATLQQQTSPEIVFNYLGQFDQTVQGSALFAFAGEDTGSWYAANSRRPHVLELNALVVDGCLELRWSFSTATHQPTTISSVGEKYLAALRELITHCTQPGTRGYTPSDFPLSAIDQANLDALVARFPLIENIYPLTPMQELFLGVSGQSGDAGFEQWRYRISGALDVAAMRAAWNLVVQRHAILRTAFVSDGLSRALQVVASHVELPFAVLDLGHLNGVDQNTALQKLLSDDRAAGFEVDRAPLMRLTLIRLADNQYEFVWSNHHLLLDRWSWPLILQEVESVYTALISGANPALLNATSYAEFLEWQQKQPETTAREFWAR